MGNKFFSKVNISAIASVVPKKKFSLIELANNYSEKEIERIINSTGIKEVTVAEDGMTSSDYAYEAAVKLISETNININDIDGLIFLTESPDYIIPNTAAVLQDRLGLRNNTINMDLRYGCAGYIYGLFQASLLIESGYCNNVLLLAGDTISHYINKNDRSLRMVNGDAACATLLTNCCNNTSSYYSFYVDGSGLNSLLIPAGGRRMPIKHGVTDILEYDKDGNGRTKENLYMNGMDIMIFATRRAPELVRDVLDKTGWDKDDVSLYAFHQANKLIVDRIAKALKISSDRIPICMEHTGNCGFDSIPLMLCTKYEGVNTNFVKTILCGFGAGLIAAACSVDLSKTKLIKTFEV